MSGRVDIGNVRGIKGEKGEKGEKGSTPSYDDLRYRKINDEFVSIKTDSSITETGYYLDANRNLCNSEGYLYDDNEQLTNELGRPYYNEVDGYYYEPLYVDEEDNYTNSKGELLDENYNVQYQISEFLSDVVSLFYKDEEGFNKLVTDVYPRVADILFSSTSNEYHDFLDAIEGDIKYYICEDDPSETIYIESDTLVNTCRYRDEDGNVAWDTDYNIPKYVPLEKNALYLYNNSVYNNNNVMRYDIYLCTKANTVPQKLVSANDFILNYNVISGLSVTPSDVNSDGENEVHLNVLTRGSAGVYTADDIDTLFANNLIDKLGANNGIAQLNGSGKVPSSQLPAFVDEVVEGTMNNAETIFTNSNNEQETGESGKIYVDTSTRKTYRWTGSAYIFISNPIVVDDGGTTAYSSTSGGALETTIGSSSLNTTAQTVTGAINELDSDKLDIVQADVNKGKNVVVDSSTGEIAFEDKNNHTHSNYLTSNDISGKADITQTIGNGDTTHSPSADVVYDTLIASTSTTKNGHTHTEYINPTIVTNLTTDDDTQVLSAKQGKELKTLVDGKADSTHNQDLSSINNTSTLTVTITYTDDSTETKNIVVYTPPSS